MFVYEIEQKFNDEKVVDIKQTVWNELGQNKKLYALPPNSRVAITAGSRGITNIVTILQEVINFLKQKQLSPFIVPSMGSHGGATAAGQVEVLKHLGITEEALQVPILSSMEVVQLGIIHDQLPVYMDKHAYEADAILVINRVKSHTAFRGKIESGLSKMVMIGLGKQKGASFVHSQGAENMEFNITEGTKYAVEHSPICMGLAIVENSYDETAIIKGVSIENWFVEEALLLEQSKKRMPSLPVKEIDVLIVEEMGKSFSGTGMDPNIIGRWRIDGVPEPKTPAIKRIAVLDLVAASHGNAQGVGLADFTTEKLFNKVDRQATYMNCITSTFLRRAMFPFIYPTEQDAIEQAFVSLGPDFNREKACLVQIANTLHLNRLIVSETALEKIDESIDYEVIQRFEFDYHQQELAYKLSTDT